MTSRETAINALLGVLTTAWPFVTVSRRNPGAENLGSTQTPALFLIDLNEDYRRPSESMPAIRTLHCLAIIYHDAGTDPNVIPASMINTILDGFDLALQPDNPMRGTCTLKGLVQSVKINGEIEKAPGDITGKSVAIIKIEVVMP